MSAPVMNDVGDLFFLRGDVRGLQLRPYRDRDETRVKARQDFAEAFAADGGVLPTGPKWTLLDGAAVLAVGGIEPLGGHSWGAWAYAAELTPRQWAFGAMMAKAVLEWAWRRFDPTSIRALAEPVNGAGRLLERIGLKPSGEPGEGLHLMTEAA